MTSHDINNDWLQPTNADAEMNTGKDMDLKGDSNIDVEAEMKVASDHEHHTKSTQSRRYVLYGLIVLALAGIAVGAIYALTGEDDSGGSTSPRAPTSAPVASPTVSPTTAPTPTSQTASPTTASYKEIEDIIRNAARQGGTEFNDRNSYQSRAMHWVASQVLPDVGLTTEEQVLQLYALVCIYYSTFAVRNAWTDVHYGPSSTLPGWYGVKGWLDTDFDDVCTWRGITCDDESRVTQIELAENGLTGSFPPEVAYLSDSLMRLDLFNNLVHNVGDEGNSFLGELTNLEYLFLGTTSFEYDGIPPAIGNLKKLKELDVSYSLFFGEIPAGMWTDLTNLVYLVLDGNAYNSTLPPDLISLPSLEFLYAETCFLEGDLEFVAQMPNIDELWVDSNHGLAGTIPVSLADSSTLRSFSATNCGLTGEIPTEIGLMSDLVRLWLHDNDLTGAIPTELGNLGTISVLKLHETQLTGEMPPQVCLLKGDWGPIKKLSADCDGEITCPEDCCTCCGPDCDD